MTVSVVMGEGLATGIMASEMAIVSSPKYGDCLRVSDALGIGSKFLAELFQGASDPKLSTSSLSLS